MKPIRCCRFCKKEVFKLEELNTFVKSSISKYGHQNLCKACATFRARTVFGQKEYTRRYRQRCGEQLKQKAAIQHKIWSASNRDKRNAVEAKRRFIKKNTVVSATEAMLIRRKYRIAHVLTVITRIAHHVDHIIPLARGGTHTLSNLQILPAKQNLQKSTTIIDYTQTKQIRKVILL